MYNIKLDENKYFTGSYAKIGKVQGGVDIPTLPPTNDATKARHYKYDYYEVTNIITVPVIDEETDEQKVDENDELMFTEETITQKVLGWFFDEEKYNAYIEAEANKPVELTQEEKVALLEIDNELLKGCIMELASVIYA